MSTLQTWKQQLDKARARQHVVVADLICAEAELVKVEKSLALRKEALVFFTKAANMAQERVSGLISTVVTSALHIVHGPQYEFIVRFVTRRNSTEADLLLMKGKNEVDPLGNSGLGVANIIAMAMRPAFILLEGKKEKFMVLDEPTAALMVAKQSAAGEVLRNLCEKLGFQIVLTTHSPELAECGDVVYHVEMDDNGISAAREIQDRDEIRLLMEG